MMTDILIILFLILLNGVFAMSELALVSAKRMRLEKAAGEGSRGARVALDLADEPSHFLSTVQVGITLISIFNGAFGEASLVAHMTPQFKEIPLLAPYAYQAALGLVVVCITIASIILGELVPKRIAMAYPEAVATLIAPPLRLLSTIMSPFVKILALATEAIVRVIGIGRHKEAAPTEEDITGMIKESTDAGVFEKTEYDIVSRALRLDDQHLKALMTPRVDLSFVDLDIPRADNLGRIACSPYSRMPVCRGDRSQIIGFVHCRDLLAQAVRANSLDAINIEAAVQEILYVPDTVSAMALLESFKKNNAELALIVDEYGDIQGMVTLTDVMSALVGDVGRHRRGRGSGRAAARRRQLAARRRRGAGALPRPDGDRTCASRTRKPGPTTRWPASCSTSSATSRRWRKPPSGASTASRCSTWTATASTSCW
jgi:putative hemolysin